MLKILEKMPLKIVKICEDNSIYCNVYTELEVIAKSLSYNVLFYHKKSLLAKPLKYDMMDKTHNAHDIFVVAADLCGQLEI